MNDTLTMAADNPHSNMLLPAAYVKSVGGNSYDNISVPRDMIPMQSENTETLAEKSFIRPGSSRYALCCDASVNP